MKRIFDEGITQLDNRPLPIECLVMHSRQDESETGEMDKNTARLLEQAKAYVRQFYSEATLAGAAA